MARVQKIISADPERLATSKNASFAIALATEMFIQHLATTTHNVVKAERKPRRNIQYRDVSSAVAKTDNLEFLVDVVPRTVTYREFKKRAKEKESAKDGEKETEEAAAKGENGVETEKPRASLGQIIAEEQTQVDNTPEAMDVEEQVERVEDSDPELDDAAKQVQLQIEMEMRGPPQASVSPPQPRRSGGFTAINGKAM